MEELYLETKNGKLPIQQDVAEKYDLHKGTVSPFSQNRIVGKNGEYPNRAFHEHSSELEWNEIPQDGFPDDGIAHMDNGFELSTSEIIDIAQGVDSE